MNLLFSCLGLLSAEIIGILAIGPLLHSFQTHKYKGLNHVSLPYCTWNYARHECRVHGHQLTLPCSVPRPHGTPSFPPPCFLPFNATHSLLFLNLFSNLCSREMYATLAAENTNINEVNFCRKLKREGGILSIVKMWLERNQPGRGMQCSSTGNGRQPRAQGRNATVTDKPSYLPGRPRNPGTERDSETCGAAPNMAAMSRHRNQANIQRFAGKLRFLPGPAASER